MASHDPHLTLSRPSSASSIFIAQDTPPTPTTTKKFQVPDPSSLSVCKGPSTAAPSSCYDFKDTVVVCVEDNKKRKEYTLLRRLLVWHSSYFAAALDPEGGWSQDKQQLLNLECSHSTFEVFCCWIHTNRLKDPVTDMERVKDIYLSTRSLLDVWVFADFRGIPALGNAAIDMLHEKIMAKSAVHANIVKMTYEKTAVGSRFRAYLIHLYKYTAMLSDMVAHPNLYTAEFLCEVLPFLSHRTDVEFRGIAGLLKVDRCQWHDHSGPGGKLRLEGRK
ncbi:hypothetical protein C7974DRAFT_469178 [Boeremia exigua]|uniref:uncharacterized protein n=1 Tax=Boeremia exigua TaxID=749465 RepID=UPI001E8EAF0C|nr:uncharacterized protein C7974DRAFT_469178 [Boeremia exigua]KAH6642946.1 hypothetical protein C7974DRAFT_469178 [Boeremia exigua]